MEICFKYKKWLQDQKLFFLVDVIVVNAKKKTINEENIITITITQLLIKLAKLCYGKPI